MKWIIDIPESTITDLKKKQNRTEVDNAVLDGEQADYNARLKADMVDMLTEIQLEIEEKKRDELSYRQTWNYPLDVCISIIQQKIDKLKEVEDGKDNC